MQSKHYNEHKNKLKSDFMANQAENSTNRGRGGNNQKPVELPTEYLSQQDLYENYQSKLGFLASGPVNTLYQKFKEGGQFTNQEKDLAKQVRKATGDLSKIEKALAQKGVDKEHIDALREKRATLLEAEETETLEKILERVEEEEKYEGPVETPEIKRLKQELRREVEFGGGSTAKIQGITEKVKALKKEARKERTDELDREAAEEKYGPLVKEIDAKIKNLEHYLAEYQTSGVWTKARDIFLKVKTEEDILQLKNARLSLVDGEMLYRQDKRRLKARGENGAEDLAILGAIHRSKVNLTMKSIIETGLIHKWPDYVSPYLEDLNSYQIIENEYKTSDAIKEALNINPEETLKPKNPVKFAIMDNTLFPKEPRVEHGEEEERIAEKISKNYNTRRESYIKQIATFQEELREEMAKQEIDEIGEKDQKHRTLPTGGHLEQINRRVELINEIIEKAEEDAKKTEKKIIAIGMKNKFNKLLTLSSRGAKETALFVGVTTPVEISKFIGRETINAIKKTAKNKADKLEEICKEL